MSVGNGSWAINHTVDRRAAVMRDQPGESLDLPGDSRGELGA